MCSLLPGYNLTSDLYGGHSHEQVFCVIKDGWLNKGSHYLIMEQRMSLALLLS